MRVDDGLESREIHLSRPNQALHLGPMIWHEMRDFSPDCVLLLLADAPYDEADYIRNYDEFAEFVRGTGS